MKALSSHPTTRRPAPDGFIVVAVLWILGALSVLVSVYAVYVIDTATGFAVHDDRLRAKALVTAAIEVAAYQQLTTSTQSHPTHGGFNFRLGQANVAVEFRSEAARIDLNMAPKELLIGLFVVLGARRDDADIYADQIIGWRTEPSSGQDSETATYRTAGLGYGPRRAKFPHVNELALVRGLPMALVERALPFLTVYSGRPQVNVLDAAPEVIAAFPGMSRERLTAVLAQRQASPQNGQALLALFGTAQQYATLEGTKTLRVTTHIAFDNGYQTNAEVIILLFEQGNEPFAVLSWRDEPDEPHANAKSWAESR